MSNLAFTLETVGYVWAAALVRLWKNMFDYAKCLLSEVLRPSVAALLCSLALAVLSQDPSSIGPKPAFVGANCLLASAFVC